MRLESEAAEREAKGPQQDEPKYPEGWRDGRHYYVTPVKESGAH
jgi:hypothetical protein